MRRRCGHTVDNAVEVIAVVVPVHDEQDLLADCLASLVTAARAVRAVTSVHVVLDACADDSARIAARFPVITMTVDAHSVGVARDAGVRSVLRSFPHVPPARLWIAHTDADSVVPAHWLSHQLALAEAGADVAIGTVRPDFCDLSPEQTDAWWATHVPGVANGHVHGANLGTRASALADAGGFPPIPLHEDVRLIEQLRMRGAMIVASDGSWVRTSGRQYGRTDGGYAEYLRTQLIPLAALVEGAERQSASEIST
ncbi:glycosyltransferase [Microbacterium elymi]|uniref:4,4'-diaponeurosporenoate glycosyltransferase n=1 Tax=Microbacterium elymi TaxID=2909587 RepID=A0ABY5NM51_9MICO|nr:MULTISPECIES: glycosyltransferase [Microbacterium]UUT36274.1 glycosyltransferase [Microbacterium elymi]